MIFIQTILYAEINIFSLTLLFLIFLNVKRRTETYLTEQKLFLALIGSNALILVLDTAMWILDGRPGLLIRVFYLLVIAIYYSFNPVICLVWSLYADYQVHKSKKHLRMLFIPLLIPTCINGILSILSIFTRQMFYIDSNNIYHRGPLFLVMVAISFFYLLYTMISILFLQHRIKKQSFIPILAFAFPPFIGGIIQTFVYGVSLIWASVTISILIIFLNIQNSQLYTDYLTGLFNRRQLDSFLQQTQNNAEERLLAGLMIDLDSFKMINDQYGHEAGDEALKQTAVILKKTFRKNDFVARYGGDEFMAIMDIRNSSDLNRAVYRLKENVNQFNTQKTVPYTLSLSVGYDIYTPAPGYNIQKFVKHLDDLMYQDKQEHEDCQKAKQNQWKETTSGPA